MMNMSVLFFTGTLAELTKIGCTFMINEITKMYRLWGKLTVTKNNYGQMNVLYPLLSLLSYEEKPISTQIWVVKESFVMCAQDVFTPINYQQAFDWFYLLTLKMLISFIF